MKIGYDAKRIFHNATGLGNYGRDLVRILNTYYPEHTYMLYNPKKKKLDRLNISGNIIEKMPAGWNKLLSSYWRRKTIIKDLVADKIELFHGLSNELPQGIDKTNIPSVVTIHDLIFMRFPEWYSLADQKIHVYKVRKAAESASHIIAISEQTKKDLITYLKIPEEKITVVYQGCHAAFKKEYTTTALNTTKTKFNLPAKFLLSVGTIEERKNLLTVIKSLHHHTLPLVVVGRKTDYYKKVENYIRENNLQDRVHFLSNVNMEELAMVYRLATVFCYPSIFEGFGIPILEALYSKVPVISSKDSCFSEAGGPGSFYIDKLNEEELAFFINKLLNDDSLYMQTITNGYEYSQNFNDDRIAKNIMELYQRVITKNDSHAA